MSEVLTIIPVSLDEIKNGDCLAKLISYKVELKNNDVIVVTQKIVSKAENRLLKVNSDQDVQDAIESESEIILRRRGQLVISQTRHGFVCANAGVDQSNVEKGYIALLPKDPDLSARRIRQYIKAVHNINVAVIISDTFGRPWRQGVVDVAIGCAGIGAILDLKGTKDSFGRTIRATEICVADEIASAAELVMGKHNSIPVAVVRGIETKWMRNSSIKQEVVRPYAQDLFR